MQVAAVHPTAHLVDAELLQNWNTALTAAHTALRHPDREVPLVPYGTAFDPAVDLVPIPSFDLPAGLPGWMAGATTWAVRGGNPEPATSADRITITIPEPDRVVR